MGCVHYCTISLSDIYIYIYIYIHTYYVIYILYIHIYICTHIILYIYYIYYIIYNIIHIYYMYTYYIRYQIYIIYYIYIHIYIIFNTYIYRERQRQRAVRQLTMYNHRHMFHSYPNFIHSGKFLVNNRSKVCAFSPKFKCIHQLCHLSDSKGK